MPEEEHEETEEEGFKTEQIMEKNGNDVTDLKDDEDRPSSPIQRTEEQMLELRRPSRIVRSDRPNKGYKSRRFMELLHGMQMGYMNK